MATNISYVYNSDLTCSTSQVIAVQACCSRITKNNGDLFSLMTSKFPYVDPYSGMEKDHIPGTIKAYGKKSEGQKTVIVMFTQINSGDPSLKKDTKNQRIEWFEKALTKLFSIKGLESVSFPYCPGCCLNEIDVAFFRNLIESQASIYPNIKINIVSAEDDPNKTPSSDSSSSESEDSSSDEKEESSDISEDTEEDSTANPDEAKSIKEEFKAKIEKLDEFMKKQETPFVPPTPKQEEVIVVEEKKEIPDDFYKWFWEEVQNLPYVNPNYYIKLYKERANVVKEDKKICDWDNSTLLEYTLSHIPKEYEPFFNSFHKSGDLQELSAFLKKESSNHVIYPELKNIYKAFELCPLSIMKVVILGQDPYHTKGAANGVAFSTCGRLQPSLRNIYNLLEKEGFSVNKSSGDLSSWCKQGVFLLNTALTVREGTPGSHLSEKENGPWENFTKQILRFIDKEKEKLVILIWGAKAREYKKYFSGKHFVIETCHPAASQHNPSNTEFVDSQCFTKTNRKLRSWKIEEIDWNIE